MMSANFWFALINYRYQPILINTFYLDEWLVRSNTNQLLALEILQPYIETLQGRLPEHELDPEEARFSEEIELLPLL